MASRFEYCTLVVDVQSADAIVVFDSKSGNPQTIGRNSMPLDAYLNSPDVGPDGWEVCGVVHLAAQARIILKRQR